MLSGYINCFCDDQYGAVLFFYIGAGAYEDIEYNYAYVMLLTLYGVGTIVKSGAKDNLFMSL